MFAASILPFLRRLRPVSADKFGVLRNCFLFIQKPVDYVGCSIMAVDGTEHTVRANGSSRRIEQTDELHTRTN